MILRNDIQDLPQGTDVAEKDVFYQDSDYLIREIYIRKKGKGNALNVRICHARNALVCVIYAAYIDTEKNMRSLLRWIPKLILTTIEEMVLQIPIMVARVVGMLTFHWRRLVW